MALYDTRFGLPQAVADYLNQGLPSIQQPYRPGYDKNYGPADGMAYTTVMPQPGYQYVYGPDGQRYSIPIPGYDPNENADIIGDPAISPVEKLSVSGGNAEGFSVYNPDPNMTRTSKNYNPRPAYEAAFGTMMGDPEANIATGALNKFDVMGPYQEKPPSGLETLFNQYVKGSLPAQLLGKGFNFLKDQLPVNKAGIFQNELLGAGFMLDNTGRIVSNNYNTPEGIMAGYNPVSGGALNFLTGGKYGDEPTYGLDKAVGKRRETVSKTLKEKYGMTDAEIAAAVAGEYEGDIPIDPITGKPTTLINRLDLFNQFENLVNKKKSAANIIFDNEIEKRRIEKEKKRIASLPKDVQQYNQPTNTVQQAIAKDNKGDQGTSSGGGFSNVSSNTGGAGGAYNEGNYCFDPSTPIQMADGSTKEIKNIQLGDDTKGGEVTGVFQFKASDEIHDYKGVTVAGSHYVKEDGRFIMVKDSPLSIKIDKIPVVYSLDTSGRRIFINDIEFADYNGDGIAKGFLANAGVDITGFDKEVLRQVENRLI